MDYLSFIDLVIPPLYLIIFFFIAYSIKMKRIEKEPFYKYFLPGLMAKIIGSIAICVVYVFYYGGGDTINYYTDCLSVSKLFLKNPYQALRFTFLPLDWETWFAFDFDTGWPLYSYDRKAIVVDKLTWPLAFISFNSFIGQTMLLSFICYFPIWRLYKMFLYEFPKLEKEFALSVLFMPSVIFWGSGLLKDSIAFAAVSAFTASFHHLIKIRKHVWLNLIYIFISSALMIMIKPYIFFAVLPGSILWFVGFRLTKVTNHLVRMTIAPALVVISILSGYLMLRLMGDTLGDYKINNVLDKAIVTQQDLKQDYYQGASFDIGDFDASVPSILSKAPAAVNVALFRPYIWEAYNPGMIVSGLENLVLLVITIYLLVKMRFYNLFLLMFKHHILFFSVFFSLFFAFSVGLTTSNFGSLVRYKIPAIPFYVASLFIIYHAYKESKKVEPEAPPPKTDQST
ncbi:MAG: hypothetical protein KA444_08460 [Bacteroidia bacterium]|nr:hypothetical protein [Bacteroidia bacterium]